MNRKQKQRWEKTRREGQRKYVLIEGGFKIGFLIFGLLMPVLQIIYLYLGSGYNFSFFDKEFQARIIVSLFISFPFGYLFGWLMWQLNEWQFRRYESRNKRIG